MDASMPRLDGRPESRDDLEMFRGEIVSFVWIGLEVKKPNRRGIPSMHRFVSGGVFALKPLDQLPIALHTPEILLCVVRIADGHIVDRMSDAKDAFPSFSRLRVHEIDPGQIRESLQPGRPAIVGKRSIAWAKSSTCSGFIRPGHDTIIGVRIPLS